MFLIHWRFQGTKIFYHEQISHENIQQGIFSELRYSKIAKDCRQNLGGEEASRPPSKLFTYVLLNSMNISFNMLIIIKTPELRIYLDHNI